MSALLIDIGNTRIKWARFENGRLSRQRAAAHESWGASDFERTVFGAARRIDRIIAVSVAGAEKERQLTRAALVACEVRPTFIRTQRKLAGVTTRYKEPWRLGADRFVAAIGGHHFVQGHAVCVVDIGTAMTIDLVDERGVHRGGAIIPGPRLMIESLLKDTSGIQRRAAGRGSGRSLFARDTRAAIEQGARHATAAVVDHAVAEAGIALGKRPVVLLTGGAAPEIRALVRVRHRMVPDLVLRGLAQLP